MGRIKIKDLPKDVEISKEEMKKMRGGYGFIRISACFACQACALTSGGTFRGACTACGVSCTTACG